MRPDLKHITNEQKWYLIDKIMKQIEVQKNKVGCFYADETYTITALKRALEIKNKTKKLKELSEEEFINHWESIFR